MSKVKTAIGALALIGGMIAAMPAVAAAEERVCRGEIGPRTVDNLRVPQGATCVLRRTYVKGTIKVQRNAILRARRVRVIGNVQGENARRVNVVRRSRVGGSVQVVQGRYAAVRRSRVNGDILLDENRRAQRVIRNRVGGNVQVFQNRARIRIRGNTVIGNLQCKENRPRPRGGNNRVHGSKEDQCARL